MVVETQIKPAQNNWSTLVFAALTLGMVSAVPMTSMPVLFKEISQDLNLNLSQIGFIWGVFSLGSIFVAPLGGILSDRLGNKRTIVIIGILSGLTGALRGLSGDYYTLLATTFLWGIISSAMLPGVTIIGSACLVKQKGALAQGFLATGGGFGMMLGSMISATLLSPLLGGWRNVFFLYGAISILLCFIWWFVIKEPESIKSFSSQTTVPFREAFKHLIRIKAIWFLGLALLLFQGCTMGMQGFLPYHLEEHGWNVVGAGGVLAVFNAAAILCVLPITLLSDRIGARKIFILLSFIFASIGVGLLSVVNNEAVWILIILAGSFSQVNAALSFALSVETTRFESNYSGTAIGLLLAMSLVGRTISPPIGNSLPYSQQGITWPFVFWAALAAAGALLLAFVKVTRKNSSLKYARNE